MAFVAEIVVVEHLPITQYDFFSRQIVFFSNAGTIPVSRSGVVRTNLRV